MKIRPVGAELFHAEGRTDMTKLIVAFHNFVNAPKKLHIKVTGYGLDNAGIAFPHFYRPALGPNQPPAQ